jgi:hypothetical protein
MKAIDILGPEEGDEEDANTPAPHDNPCHTTYEADEQRPPLNLIFATVVVRRGVGRKENVGGRGRQTACQWQRTSTKRPRALTVIRITWG